MWWEIGLELPLIGILSALHLRRLASRTVPPHVLVSVWVSYVLAFSLTLLVPLDLNLVYVQRCLNAQAITSVDSGDVAKPSCNMGFFRTWRVIYPDISDEEAITLCNQILRHLWKGVWGGNAALGWILLTLQQKFEESRRFSVRERISAAVQHQAGFFATVAVLLSGLVVLLALAGQDINMVFVGLMAVGNAVMLLVEALLLGYGLVEFPISLWQEARRRSKLRRCLFAAKGCSGKLTRRAATLSSHLAALHALRKAASSSLRHVGELVMQMTREAPLDVESLMLMDPVRGSSIPSSREELETAFHSRLKEVHQAQKLSLQVTEVDQWLEALESNGLLPEGSDVFAVQDALHDAGCRTLAELDWLDPAASHREGEAPAVSEEQRQQVIRTQLRIFFVPDEPALLRALAEAITARGDWKIAERARVEEEMAGGAELEGAEPPEEALVAGLPARLWTKERLASLRTAMYDVNRSYRKTKRKFDLAVREAILLQDLRTAKAELMPFSSLVDTLWRAARHAPSDRIVLLRSYSGLQEGIWPGFVCSVRERFTGRFGLKLEALCFFGRLFVLPPLRIFLACLCGVLSVCVLWSEAVLAPWLRRLAGGPQEGSLLLHHVCWLATVPPGCLDEQALDLGQVRVVNWVQVIVLVHILYILLLSHFSLSRLRLFRMYEIVPGETDANTLLVNAFLMCRLVPSICHNYLNMLHEAHETRLSTAETVFEETFSAMGKIPFVGSSFNDVLPPVLMAFFLLNLVFVIGRQLFSHQRAELFDLIEDYVDGQALTFEPDEVRYAEWIVQNERRSYDRMANMKRTFSRRGQEAAAATQQGARSNGVNEPGSTTERAFGERDWAAESGAAESGAAGSMVDKTAEAGASSTGGRSRWQEVKALLPGGGESEQEGARWSVRYEKTEGVAGGSLMGVRMLQAKAILSAVRSGNKKPRPEVMMREPSSMSGAPMLSPKPSEGEEDAGHGLRAESGGSAEVHRAADSAKVESRGAGEQTQ